DLRSLRKRTFRALLARAGPKARTGCGSRPCGQSTGALRHGRANFAPTTPIAPGEGAAALKYWIDTEFIERPHNIDLISRGGGAEDGRKFYAESSEVDWSKASRWTLQTVRPQLDGGG